ncbi:hypothetical protein [Burkholderia pyrrocinia]|uniref:hypothetical protein n=1 Tax=Burkholderia pyrrocinia TaxID=60550 RepID=UPI001588447B|nr:hypothetical protein [Burkholderia pyrrocinia]
MDFANGIPADVLVKHAKTIVHIGTVMAGFAVNAKLAPDKNDVPIPRAILFVVVFLIALSVAYMVAPGNLGMWCLVACAITLLAVIGYNSLCSRYRVKKELMYQPPRWKCWDTQRTEERFILGGFVLRPHARAVIEETGISVEELLLDAAGDENRIWKPWSRAALISIVFALYLLATEVAAQIWTVG